MKQSSVASAGVLERAHELLVELVERVASSCEKFQSNRKPVSGVPDLSDSNSM